tara:strand:- start:95 stop:1231 length:1137 start_codon:yes stop_codon:yes gene_type:complete
MQLVRNSNSVDPPYLNFGKSRATATGGVTAVNSNDILGEIAWSAGDGTDLNNVSGKIQVKAELNAAGNQTPGRMEFHTTAAGAGASTERMRIDDNGNVIVNNGAGGNFSVDDDNSRALTVAAGSNANAMFVAHSSGRGVGYFGYDGGGDRLIIGVDNGSGGNSIQFSVNAGSSSDTNNVDGVAAAVTINASGNMIISSTGWDGNLDTSDTNVIGHFLLKDGRHYMQIDANTTGFESILLNNIHSSGADAAVLQYRTQGANEGSLNGSSSGLAIVNVSDYRKKENIADLSGSLAKIKALRPVTFTHRSAYTTDTSAVKTGMIAHEVAEVLPNLVVGEKDAVDDDGNIILQALSYSADEMITHLIGAIKELEARIATLEG